MKTKLIISGLAFMAITTLTIAQTVAPQNNSEKCSTYVDANNNGVCDNYETKTPGVSCGTMNGTCVGSNNESGMGQGMGRMGRMGRMGQAQQSQCKDTNFVDADKNGVCDFLELPAKK